MIYICLREKNDVMNSVIDKIINTMTPINNKKSKRFDLLEFKDDVDII